MQVANPAVLTLPGQDERHGAPALATYKEYTQVAQKNQSEDKFGKAHVHVVLFDGVTDPQEIGEDLVTLAS